MVVTQKLTPEAFLSAPRRGPAIPNHNGSLGLHTVSTHIFGKGTVKELRVMDLGSGVTWQISEDEKVHDAKWIPEDPSEDIIWLKSADKGVTQVVISTDNGSAEGTPKQYVAAEIDAPVQHLKMKRLDNGSVALAVVGLVGKDGGLHNEEAYDKKASTARIYDTLHVREWDTYVEAQRHAIWYSKLVKDDDSDKWKLAAPLQNALKDTTLGAPSRIHDLGDPSSGFDIGPKGIIFAATDPKSADSIYYAASDVYFVPLDDFASPPLCRPLKTMIQGESSPGMSTNLRFSPDGTMIAYLKIPIDCPVDVRILMGHINSLTTFDLFSVVISKRSELETSSFEFAPHGNSLFLIAEDFGRQALYELEISHHAKPKLLLKHSSVEAFHPFFDSADNLLLLTSSSSLLDSSIWHVVGLRSHDEPRVVSAALKHGAKFGLSHSQISEFWFEGGGDYCVHAWMIKPRNFDENKKYPWVLMVHGGPEDAWHDKWHMRWNAAVWAEQGYIIIQPNVTGSTGFGMDFVSGVYGDWGGRPYKDLVNCVQYLKNVPSIDLDRAVLAGASYGGYMVNWVFGQPLAKKFKAAICHDSVFNVPSFMLQSDAAAGKACFDGPNFPWSNWEGMNKYNPARPDLLKNWKHAPPTLVIHSDKDFRCPVTEGLAVFRTLQWQGVPSRLLTFPDENHFVQKPENSLVWHRTVFEWMDKWVNNDAGTAQDQGRDPAA